MASQDAASRVAEYHRHAAQADADAVAALTVDPKLAEAFKKVEAQWRELADVVDSRHSKSGPR